MDKSNLALTGVVFVFASLMIALTKPLYLRSYPSYLRWIKSHKGVVAAGFAFTGAMLVLESIFHPLMLNQELKWFLLIAGLLLGLGCRLLTNMTIAYAEQVNSDMDSVAYNGTVGSWIVGAIGILLIVVGVMKNIVQR